jgi:glycosyltransferase involved in cell wall biosynthesis
MSDPLVSVVIPCYNAEKHVEKCIERVYSQTYSRIEVIAVNDGSTDNTLSILKRLKQKYSDLTLLNGPNERAPRARNRGLEKTDGKYIQFLDADDLLKPTKIAHQVMLAEGASERVDLVAGAYIRELPSGEHRPHPVEKDDPWIGLLRVRLGITSANLWRTKKVLEIGGWDSSWEASQDAEFTFRLLKAGGRVKADDEMLTVKREPPDGINRGDQERMLRHYFKSRKLILDYLRGEGMFEERKDRIAFDWMFRFWQNYYQVDRDRAVAMFDRVFPHSFVPPRMQQGSPPVTRLYQLVYRYWGVQAAQKIGRYENRVKRGIKRRLGQKLN